MRISILTKFLLTIVAVTLFTLGPVTFLAVRGFLADKSLDVFDRNNLIARNVAVESHAILADAQAKMRIFAGVYFDPSLPADKREPAARTIFTHFDGFVRLTVIADKAAPIRVHNKDVLKRAGLTEAKADAAIDAVAPLPTGEPPEGGVWVLNRTPSVELPLITVVVDQKTTAGTTVRLVGDLVPESLFDLFRLEGATKIYLVDGAHAVLADPDAARMVKHETDANLSAALQKASGTNGTFEFALATNDEKQLATWAAVGLGGARVVAHTPERVAFAPARKLVANSVLIACSVFVLAAIVSVFLARRMTQPLVGLSRATERIAKGDFGTTVDIASHDEIGDLAASFNKMGEELRLREKNLEEARAALIQSEKMAAFGQLGAGIAHEVKNPLAGILGYAQLALRKLPAEAGSLKSYLEIVEKETKRCKAIIENLLKFARQEKTVMDRVDVSTLVDEAMKLVEHQLNMNGVKISRGVPPGLPPIFANANQLQQVLMNLSINAQHAMEKSNGGTLTVTAVETKLPEGIPAVEIRVTDSGSGIPKEILTKIFEPFFTTKPAGKGTGLGLSVTFGIIRDHKGQVLVDSQVGVGTTFRLILPVAPAVPAQAEAPAASSA